MSRQAAALFVIGFALLAAPAHAGWTDALKKEANKAVKGEKKPASSMDNTGPVTQSRLEVPPTPELFDKFKASLQLEIDERARITKTLKGVKPADEYNKCKQDYMLSAEGQKFSQKYVDGMKDKSPDEIQKHIESLGKEMEAAIEKSCGLDPGTYNDGWARQQTREALGKASDQFQKDDYAYQTWKEWITEFCNYVGELKKKPDAAKQLAKIKDEGLRIPGSGAGIYYVYTASEANMLLERCDSLMPMIQATL